MIQTPHLIVQNKVKNVASYLACCSYLPFGNHTIISFWWVFSIKPDDQTDETESSNLVNKIELKAKPKVSTKLSFDKVFWEISNGEGCKLIWNCCPLKTWNTPFWSSRCHLVSGAKSHVCSVNHTNLVLWFETLLALWYHMFLLHCDTTCLCVSHIIYLWFIIKTKAIA